MLRGLYFLFNNNLELDSYIAIEAISVMADEEILVDVILMCNSIKNLIQQNKSEPSVQNALLNSTSNGTNVNPKANRSASIISSKKKILESVAGTSASSSPVAAHLANMKKTDSIIDSNSNGSQSPQSGTHYFMKSSDKQHSVNINDVYVSPSAEVRSAVRLASIKVQKQQFFETVSIENLPPPLPNSPPPMSVDSRQNSCEHSDEKEIPNIDENVIENDDGSSSFSSVIEKF